MDRDDMNVLVAILCHVPPDAEGRRLVRPRKLERWTLAPDVEFSLRKLEHFELLTTLMEWPGGDRVVRIGAAPAQVREAAQA